MPNKARISIDQRGEANLRKLARALIALAQRQLDAEQVASGEDAESEPGAA